MGALALLLRLLDFCWRLLTGKVDSGPNGLHLWYFGETLIVPQKLIQLWSVEPWV
jgi:hypothetical protein